MNIELDDLAVDEIVTKVLRKELDFVLECLARDEEGLTIVMGGADTELFKKVEDAITFLLENWFNGCYSE